MNSRLWRGQTRWSGFTGNPRQRVCSGHQPRIHSRCDGVVIRTCSKEWGPSGAHPPAAGAGPAVGTGDQPRQRRRSARPRAGPARRPRRPPLTACFTTSSRTGCLVGRRRGVG